MTKISRVGKWAGIGILLVLSAIAGVIASLVIGGIGLALMGTAVGVGPVGWVGIMVVACLALYGGVCLLRRK